MTYQGFEAARTLVDDALRIGRSLSIEEWTAPSAADGWTVQDVYTHMAYFFNTIADPEVEQPDNPSGKAEVLNDLSVEERGDWSPDQTMEYYTTQSTAGLVALEALQSPEMAEATLELADLGTYNLSLLADAVAFDHLVHLTSDILAPHGPIKRQPLEMSSERLQPTLNWMIAGLPQMCGQELKPVLDSPVGIVLNGLGARSIVLSKSEGKIHVEDVQDPSALPEDRAESTTDAFLRWGTQRELWSRAVTTRGDKQYVTRVLDAINII
jgi:hypothetical protein